ncbi:glycosyltransferase [Sulfitobacter sp. 1A13353]|uniref:glycosyltransferase n=1 Tax=Sulfitobacter sp. 1A13353 TaxID=3368568 RepID=UPI003745CA9C
MSPIYYDLSEQFLSSGVKFQYYGIARTVMEVGYELARSPADVRFVVFSPAHDRFFEVNPRIGADSETGVCDPNIPHEAKPMRIRYSFPEPHKLRDALYPFLQAFAKRICLKRWERAVPEGHVREVDLSGQIVVSLGRPKMMSDYLVALDKQNVRMRFFPLLHDMIPLHEFSHPRQSMFARNFAHDNRIVIEHAEKLLANSLFTKTEIEHFAALGRLPDIPDVVPTPLPHELRKVDEPIEVEIPQAPYLLGVGVMTGRKNLECVLEAMLQLHNTGRPVPMLLLAGAHRKRTVACLNKPEIAPIRDKIQLILNPNQASLRLLYQKALALVIPSHMEGFGLPLGEALWVGTPALAAAVPALQEVGGDLAEYFDPNDPNALAALIDKMHTDPEAYEAVKDKVMRNRAELRTWKDVAADIIAAVSPHSKRV